METFSQEIRPKLFHFQGASFAEYLSKIYKVNQRSDCTFHVVWSQSTLATKTTKFQKAL